MLWHGKPPGSMHPDQDAVRDASARTYQAPGCPGGNAVESLSHGQESCFSAEILLCSNSSCSNHQCYKLNGLNLHQRRKGACCRHLSWSAFLLTPQRASRLQAGLRLMCVNDWWARTLTGTDEWAHKAVLIHHGWRSSRQLDLPSEDDPDSKYQKTKYEQVVMPCCVPSALTNGKNQFSLESSTRKSCSKSQKANLSSWNSHANVNTEVDILASLSSVPCGFRQDFTQRARLHASYVCLFIYIYLFHLSISDRKMWKFKFPKRYSVFSSKLLHC